MRRIAHELRRFHADHTRNGKDRQIADRRIVDQCNQWSFLDGLRSGIEIDSNILYYYHYYYYHYQVYHKDCFVCAECGETLTGIVYYNSTTGKPNCQRCFDQTLHKCQACGGLIKVWFEEFGRKLSLTQTLLSSELCSVLKSCWETFSRARTSLLHPLPPKLGGRFAPWRKSPNSS